MTVVSATPAQAEPKIYTPGHYPDMKDTDYHGSAGFSSSNLKVLNGKTYNHMMHEKANSASTETMNLGSATHTLTLEPHLFDQNFAVRKASLKKPTRPQLNAPKKTPATQKLCDEWAAWQEEVADRTEITEEQFNHANRMAQKVREHPQASMFVENNFVEQSIFAWYNPEDWDARNDYRIMCKVRPDNGLFGHSVLFDLKTAVDASFTGFMKAIKKYSYHMSGVMYLDICNRCSEFKEFAQVDHFNKFVWIVVENEPPHEVACYEMNSYAFEEGSGLYHSAVRRLYEYNQSQWKGYGEFDGKEFQPQTRLTDIPRWGNPIA